MANRILSIFLLQLATLLTLSAQTVNDALRYSVFEVGGTARAIGAGGAMGALGADLSVASTNPAGIGWYRSSEFIISPSIFTANTDGTLLGSDRGPTISENRTNFNLNGFGVVLASRPRASDWTTLNFAVGLNRLANFNQNFIYQGQTRGSIIDRFQEQANSTAGISDFESGLAIDTDALYDINDPPDGFYESDMELAPDALIFREQSIETRGSINELVFTLAGSYRDRLLIGATLGVPFLSYTDERSYREEDPAQGQPGNVPYFDDLRYTERLNTTGAGINFKLGVVVRASQMVRLGFAVHTPTAYSLEDDFRTFMEYRYTDDLGVPLANEADSPEGFFNYRLNTPWRFIGSGGLVIGKSGFVSAEFEWLDYGNNKFRYDGFIEDEQLINSDINAQLSKAWNLRLGGELAIGMLRLRGGAGLQQSPWADDDTLNNTFSGGIGIRKQKFFADFAYQRRNIEEAFVPYLTAEAPQQEVLKEAGQNQFVATVGFRF